MPTYRQQVLKNIGLLQVGAQGYVIIVDVFHVFSGININMSKYKFMKSNDNNNQAYYKEVK